MDNSELIEQYKSVTRSLRDLDARKDAFLRRLEQDRADYAQLRDTYQKMLARRGLSNGNMAPSQELPMRLTDLFVSIIESVAPEAIHAKEIWERAAARGAATESEDPTKNTDSILTQYVKRDDAVVESVGGRMYRKKRPVSGLFPVVDGDT